MANERTLEELLQHRLAQAEERSESRRANPGGMLARWGLRALATVIGAAVWAACVGVVVIGPKNPGGLVAVLLCLPLIGATALTMRGWRWLPQYQLGTYGHFFKFLALLGVVMTVVGIVPICYWTGLAILQMVSEPLL